MCPTYYRHAMAFHQEALNKAELSKVAVEAMSKKPNLVPVTTRRQKAIFVNRQIL